MKAIHFLRWMAFLLPAFLTFGCIVRLRLMDMLAKAKINADRDNRERWEREGRIAPTKKNDMEL